MTAATVRKATDFEVTGKGSAAEWAQADWLPLSRVGQGNAPYATRAKLLYSDTGMYFLFDCEDRRLTCTMTEDYDEIYKEDVVEVFLWPDESQVLYFEYQNSDHGLRRMGSGVRCRGEDGGGVRSWANTSK